MFHAHSKAKRFFGRDSHRILPAVLRRTYDSLSHVPAQHPLKSIAYSLKLARTEYCVPNSKQPLHSSDAACQGSQETQTVMRVSLRDVNLAWAEHWLCREESDSGLLHTLQRNLTPCFSALRRIMHSDTPNDCCLLETFPMLQPVCRGP